MTPEEKESFRTQYTQWPTDRLARTVTLEKKDYRPEAVALMLEVLKTRGLSEEKLPEVVASVPPPLLGTLPERDTWLFPARLARGRYIIRAFVFLVTIIGAAVALEMFPILQPGGFVILFLVALAYGAIGLLLPRSKDAGFSPGFLAILFFLFPITGFGTFVCLFFVPSKR